MNFLIKLISYLGTGMTMCLLLFVGFSFVFLVFGIRLCIIVGAFNSLYHFEYFNPVSPDPFTQICINWDKFAIFVVFLESWKRKRDMSELKKANSVTKKHFSIFASYFGFGFSTKRTDEFRTKSFISNFWKSLDDLQYLFKEKTPLEDDDYTAYPTRNIINNKPGDITFHKDIVNAITK